jgi:hypothetical protein
LTNNRRLRGGRIALLALAIVVTVIAAALAATRSAPGATRTAQPPTMAAVAHHAGQER